MLVHTFGMGSQTSGSYTLPTGVQQVKTLQAWKEENREGKEPLIVPLVPLVSTKSMRLVIFTTNAARTQFTLREIIDGCMSGTDVIFLDGIHTKNTLYGTSVVADGSKIVPSLLKMLRRSKIIV